MSKYLFSVIIPIYNTEDYLEEAILSVVNQTVGFEENIQLILVNDGSTDGSGDICKKYSELYPKNILYLEKENGGVSSARNMALGYVEGQYVNFLDSDDKWKDDAFSYIRDFFSENPEVKVATARLMQFEATTAYSHLDYKYTKTRVVDIFKDYRLPEYSVAKTFFHSELLSSRRFSEELEISEDTFFINNIILEEGKYGLVREAIYNYRKRLDKSSTIDSAPLKRSWYAKTIRTVYLGLIDKSKELFGEVIPYVQYLLITNLQWRVMRPIPDYLPTEDKEDYIESIKEVLSHIEDTIIMQQRRMSYWHKVYAIKLKHSFDGKEVDPESYTYIPGIFKLSCQIIDADKRSLIIEGVGNEKFLSEELNVYGIDENKNKFYPSYQPSPNHNRRGVDENIILYAKIFRMELPLREGAHYSFGLESKEKEYGKIDIYPGKFSRLNASSDSFFATKEYIFKYLDGEIHVLKYTPKEFIESNNRLNERLLKEGATEVVELRKQALEDRLLKVKPVWLVSDRTDSAADNGFALFKYLMKGLRKYTADIYFILSKDSPDFNKVSKVGKVIEYGSPEHFRMQLQADMILSSSGQDWCINPFMEIPHSENLKDFLDASFVSLRHGIIMNDMSKWLHRFNKKIDLFVTSAKPEYRSIIEGNYCYTEKEVKLLGLARFDLLSDKRKKKISIMPTWRKPLAPPLIHGGSAREYNPLFKESEYFLFFNSLINDERLISTLKKNGYTGEFILHPSHSEQAPDFKENDTIKIHHGSIDYSQIFSESALLVTDYSSVAMDFAYLNKPVLYAQFDKEEFFGGQVFSPGYFDYERDGFGDVVDDYESALNAIVDLVENNCSLSEKYKARIKDFFGFNDTGNCKRLYKAIKELQKQRA